MGVLKLGGPDESFPLINEIASLNNQIKEAKDKFLKANEGSLQQSFWFGEVQQLAKRLEEERLRLKEVEREEQLRIKEAERGEQRLRLKEAERGEEQLSLKEAEREEQLRLKEVEREEQLRIKEAKEKWLTGQLLLSI